MKIDKDTNLCLINSRWGSRLTLNLNFKERSIETGSLGIDISDDQKIKYSHQNLQQLKFYVKAGTSDQEGFYFSKLNSYLAAQELSVGLTYLTLKGIHSSGLNVEFTIHSPITFAPELENDENFKLMHAPYFNIEIIVKNISNITQNSTIFIGFDMEGQLINKNLIFEDNGKNMIEKGEKKFLFKNLQKDLAHYYKDEHDDKFRGYLVRKEINSDERIELKFIYSAFVGNYVFLNKLNKKNPHKLKFYYTQLFRDIDELSEFVEKNYDDILKKSALFENLLASYEAPPEKKFLIAIAFRTFLANTWLLISDENLPEYYVWEGSFGLNSSIDVAMEVEILAKIFPWTLKLQLIEWKKYITILNSNGLYYLMHDMGKDQEAGYSYYDRENSESKPLAVENNSNFTILLYWYYHITQDKELMEELYPVAYKLLTANIKRGFRKRGLAHIDTNTTYNDSNTLYNAPLNTYLGIKQCISYIMGRELSSILGLKKDSELLQNEAEKILETLNYTYEKYGYIPISLDPNYPDWNKKTIATADPLFYVAMSRLKDSIIEKLIKILVKDFNNIYYVNDTRIYGIRLVENEEITWFSKIAVIDAVSTILFNLKKDSWKYAYDWNKNNPLAYCDGAFSEDKGWNGTRYPRGISLMWEVIYKYKE